jgi:hypothetical protein
MRQAEWLDNKRQLESLFDLYDQIPNNFNEVKAHWIRYLVVRTSGFIEVSLSDFLVQYSEDKAAPRVLRFVDRRLEYPGNMAMERILGIIHQFGEDWHDEIKNRPDFDQMKSAINSLIAIRNAVAHGQSVSTGMAQLREYLAQAIALLEIIFEQCSREVQPYRFSRRQRRQLANR